MENKEPWTIEKYHEKYALYSKVNEILEHIIDTNVQEVQDEMNILVNILVRKAMLNGIEKERLVDIVYICYDMMVKLSNAKGS